MLTGAVLAFGQSDIKRMFAYSSISQIGFVALGFGIGTPLAVFGSLFYLFNHSIVKSLFFLNSGAIEYIAGTRDLSKIRGLVARSPVVGYTLLAGTLSIAGVPPFGFFWAKLIIIFACVVSGHPFLGLAAAAASVMTIGYYLNALTPAMFEKGSDGQHHAGRRISSAEAVPMVLLACIAVAGAAALLPGPANTLLRQATTFLINSSHHVVVVAGAVK
jgi:multicomponent Na+:H+ antiporter subunit D